MNTLIVGPMYGGKSTALLQKMERAVYGKKRIALVRPKKGTRDYFTHSAGNELLEKFIKEGKISLFEVEEITEENAMSILDNFDRIFVDEYFMIKNVSLLAKMANEVVTNQDVYFAGLLSTSENTLFPEAISLLPYCDDIIKLLGICMRCGSDLGNYSMFKGGEKKETIVVGDNDKYECVCRKCYKRVKGAL